MYKTASLFLDLLSFQLSPISGRMESAVCLKKLKSLSLDIRFILDHFQFLSLISLVSHHIFSFTTFSFHLLLYSFSIPYQFFFPSCFIFTFCPLPLSLSIILYHFHFKSSITFTFHPLSSDASRGQSASVVVHRCADQGGVWYIFHCTICTIIVRYFTAEVCLHKWIGPVCKKV